jgi:NitT/TauT family transport system substrate-binding protein
MATLSLSLMLALASCGGGEATLSIATNRWPGYEPLYLARELDYFDGAGASLVELPSASRVIDAFRNEHVNAAALTLDEALLLAQDEIPVKILLVTDISNGGDAVMARSEIKSLADLAGKRVGVESFALGAYMLSRTLETAGLKHADIRIVPLTVDQHEEAYKSGLVDAVVTFEPVRTKLLAEGAHVLFDSSRIPDEIFDVLVIREDFAARHPEQVAHLQEAWFRALDYLREQPQDAAERMAKRLDITAPQFLESLHGLRIPDHEENMRLLHGANPALIEPANRLVKVMVEGKLLRVELDPRRLIANGIGGK